MKELNDQQLTALRIAIAEDQNWKRKPSPFGCDQGKRKMLWESPDFMFSGEVGEEGTYPDFPSSGPPDYCRDRSAIVEAIVGRFNTGELAAAFVNALENALPRPIKFASWSFTLATAPAQTLALAYVRAAGLKVEGVTP